MDIATIGLDLAKNVFQLHALNHSGRTVLRRRLRRTEVLSFFARLPVCLVGMEACWGAHYWAREIQKLGHTVRLMAPQYVKAYVKTNKNDAADAEAIAEAVTRPSMRFVPLKTQDQQAMLALHRVRQGLIKARTAQANQIRSFLAECGIVIPAGLGRLRRALPVALSEDERVDGLMRQLLVDLAARLRSLDDEVSRLDRHIAEFNRRNQDCRRLETIPGVGPVTASALVAAVGNATAFRNGRELAAWLGLVPRQNSSGGKDRLLGISKRGDSYLRTLLIHGARSMLMPATARHPEPDGWLARLLARKHRNVAVVALANKNARRAWALLARGEVFHPMAPTAT